MEEITGKFEGFFNFKSKEDKIFYIIQVSVRKLGDEGLKASIVNVFVDEQKYLDLVKSLEIGTDIKISVSANFDTGKVNYRLVD